MHAYLSVHIVCIAQLVDVYTDAFANTTTDVCPVNVILFVLNNLDTYLYTLPTYIGYATESEYGACHRCGL